MESSAFDTYLKDLIEKLQVNEAGKPIILDHFDSIPSNDVNKWFMKGSLYNVNAKSSDTRYFSLFTFRDEKNMLSVYSVTMRNS